MRGAALGGPHPDDGALSRPHWPALPRLAGHGAAPGGKTAMIACDMISTNPGHFREVLNRRPFESDLVATLRRFRGRPSPCSPALVAAWRHLDRDHGASTRSEQHRGAHCTDCISVDRSGDSQPTTDMPQNLDSRLLMSLLANGLPLMFLPDLVWPGRIPSADPAALSAAPHGRTKDTATRIRERTKLASVTVTTTGERPSGAPQTGSVSATPPAARGRHARTAAAEEQGTGGGASSGRHRKHVRGRHARGADRLEVARPSGGRRREAAISAAIAVPASIARATRR